MNDYSATYQTAQIPVMTSMITHSSIAYTTGKHFSKGIMPARNFMKTLYLLKAQ